MYPNFTPVHRNIPDSRGTNAYLSDPDFAKLLRLYLGPEMFEAVEQRFIRLGTLVRGELEELALTADMHPPKLHLRARNGAESERIEKHPSPPQLIAP